MKAGKTLDVYLLPTTDWRETGRLQQRLAYELGEAPRLRSALVVGEHFPMLTVGRHGSRRQIGWEPGEFVSRQIDTQWTNRAAGCWLFLPGMLAINFITPLDPRLLTPTMHRERLHEVLIDVLAAFHLVGQRRPSRTGVWIDDRPVADVGFAVKDWIAYHGMILNVRASIDDLAGIRPIPKSPRPWTSMARQLRTPIRMEKVREAIIHNVQQRYGIDECVLCHLPTPTTAATRRLIDARNP